MKKNGCLLQRKANYYLSENKKVFYKFKLVIRCTELRRDCSLLFYVAGGIENCCHNDHLKYDNNTFIIRRKSIIPGEAKPYMNTLKDYSIYSSVNQSLHLRRCVFCFFVASKKYF